MPSCDDFVLPFPLERPHCGMPLANGNMGALIWGAGCRLCVTVNRSDYWDHRCGERVLPGQSYRELVETFDPLDVRPTNKRFIRQKLPLDVGDFWWRPTRLPAGRFEFVLDDALREARLDYATGVVDIVTQAGRRVSWMMARNRSQLLARDPDRLIRQVRPCPAWEWVSSTLQRAGFAPPVPFSEGETVGWFQPSPDDLGLCAACAGGEDRWHIAVTREAGAVRKIGDPADWDEALAANRAWWRRYWDHGPTIRLSHNPWLTTFYRLALYKFACATDPQGVACGLQGPWVEEYQRTPWQGGYVFNVNIQQIYTLALGIGAYAHMHPLFDMLESDPFQYVMRENARNLLEIEDGLLLTHAVDDRGMQCGGIMTGSVLDFSCGGWMAQLYWLYYQHTRDVEFLRRRAMPFMRGVMRGFEAAFQEEAGRLSIPLGVSAEYGLGFPVMVHGQPRIQNCGRNASNQLMCAHMLAQALLEACAILGEPSKPVWRDIRRRLPPYTTGGSSGAVDMEHILLWEGQDLDVCHRHHSHLALIYPFATFDPSNAEQARIVNNTVDHWILRGMGQWSEWCYPWAAIIHARMGFSESPRHLLELWRALFVNEGWATVYLPRFHGLTAHRREDMDKPRATNEIMQLDGTMAGATAIMEMLVHQQAGVIHLFRGIPADWSEAAFERIRLPGGLSVSASMRHGQLENVTITTATEQTVPIEFRGRRDTCVCRRREGV